MHEAIDALAYMRTQVNEAIEDHRQWFIDHVNASATGMLILHGDELKAYLAIQDAAVQAHRTQTAHQAAVAVLRDSIGGLCRAVTGSVPPFVPKDWDAKHVEP